MITKIFYDKYIYIQHKSKYKNIDQIRHIIIIEDQLNVKLKRNFSTFFHFFFIIYHIYSF
jgi:hypothetical protein